MGTEPSEPREAPEAPLPRGWKLGSMNSKSTRRKASLKPLGKLRFLLCLYWYMYIYIYVYVKVSINLDTPKWMVYKARSPENGNLHMLNCFKYVPNISSSDLFRAVYFAHSYQLAHPLWLGGLSLQLKETTGGRCSDVFHSRCQ